MSISWRGASSIADDITFIIFLEKGLAKSCELKDIFRELDRNVKRSGSLILTLNIACIVGVFTRRFGIMASVVTNNVAAMAALGNGILPLRQMARVEAERRHKREKETPMPWNELLYERQLKRPLDEEIRQAIDAEYKQRRHQIPIPTEFRWHSTRPEFTIRSKLLSFVVKFTTDHRMIVNAELTLAAKLMATDKNRREAVKFIESIATEVGL